jgi:hypothetical protein
MRYAHQNLRRKSWTEAKSTFLNVTRAGLYDIKIGVIKLDECLKWVHLVQDLNTLWWPLVDTLMNEP